MLHQWKTNEGGNRIARPFLSLSGPSFLPLSFAPPSFWSIGRLKPRAFRLVFALHFPLPTDEADGSGAVRPAEHERHFHCRRCSPFLGIEPIWALILFGQIDN